VSNPSHWRRYTVLVGLGGAILALPALIDPSTRVYVLPAFVGTLVLLGAVLAVQWHSDAARAKATGVFESWSSARGPQGPIGELELAGVGLVRGPVGRLRVDADGVRWLPRWRKSHMALAAPWREISRLSQVPITGLGQPVYVALELRSGERWSFATSSGPALAATVAKYLTAT
jgi:hypothetical protein